MSTLPVRRPLEANVVVLILDYVTRSGAHAFARTYTRDTVQADTQRLAGTRGNIESAKSNRNEASRSCYEERKGYLLATGYSAAAGAARPCILNFVDMYRYANIAQ